MIVVVMYLLIITGKKFGVSSSFQAMCSAAGGNRIADYFKYDWRSHTWLLLFVTGAIIGGYLSSTILNYEGPLSIAATTMDDLAQLGVQAPAGQHAESLLPSGLFTLDILFSLKGLLLFVVGGFLIGFGTRWAGGCTSGHAITGLSNLQLPSLVAVIGFFIGGLAMTHFILPIILSL